MMKKICIAAMLLGVVLLLVGMYYLMIKAGIPYQDPTPEMTKQYVRNENIGAISFFCGLVVEILGGIGLIVTQVLKKRKLHRMGE